VLKRPRYYGSRGKNLYNRRLRLNFYFIFSIIQFHKIGEFLMKKTFNTEKYCYPCGSGLKVIDWNDPKKQYRMVFFFNFLNWCHRIGKFWLKKQILLWKTHFSQQGKNHHIFKKICHTKKSWDSTNYHSVLATSTHVC
jgi:hypothetical protein